MADLTSQSLPKSHEVSSVECRARVVDYSSTGVTFVSKVIVLHFVVNAIGNRFFRSPDDLYRRVLSKLLREILESRLYLLPTTALCESGFNDAVADRYQAISRHRPGIAACCQSTFLVLPVHVFGSVHFDSLSLKIDDSWSSSASARWQLMSGKGLSSRKRPMYSSGIVFSIIRLG